MRWKTGRGFPGLSRGWGLLLRPLALSISRWRNRRHALEIPAEIELVAVTGLLGDFCDRIVRFDQTLLGLVDPFTPQPVDRTGSRGGFEMAEEVRNAHPGHRRQFGDPQWLLKVKPHCFQRLVQRRR